MVNSIDYKSRSPGLKSQLHYILPEWPLSKLHTLFLPQFPHLQNEDYLLELLQRLNELIFIKLLKLHLKHSKKQTL